MGAGGSASSFQFDATGLSSDPRLAPYLQSLTPAQLQTALDGRDPSGDLSQLIEQEQTGTGAGWLPCGGANDPTCSGGAAASSVPLWVWLAGGGALAFALLRK